MNQYTYFNTFGKTTILVYILSLFGSFIIYYPFTMEWYAYIFSLVEVGSFFYIFANFHKRDRHVNISFKKIFWTAFLLRAIYVIFIYAFYMYYTGEPFSFHAADAHLYDELALFSIDKMQQGNFNLVHEIMYNHPYGHYDFSDTGFPIVLSIVYLLSFKTILLARILLCLFSAWGAVLIYKITQHYFDNTTAKLTVCMYIFLPNLIIYCGYGLKESFMSFLILIFIYEGSKIHSVISTSFFVYFKVTFILLLFFMFRTVLGIVGILAILLSILPQKMSIFNKILLYTILTIMSIFILPHSIYTTTSELWEHKDTNQARKLESMTARNQGNNFSQHASKTIFIPLMFTLPFPSTVYVKDQENLRIINGGHFIKNVLSFFILVALIFLFTHKMWRQRLFIISFASLYLLIIAMSGFAYSGRFHFPVLPLELIFISFGLSVCSKNSLLRKISFGWIFMMGMILIVWGWFKLAGRGVI